MTKRMCEGCGLSLMLHNSQARTCSPRCRKRVSRRKQLPTIMTSANRWVRRDGKRPVTASGTPASSTKPDTWSSFQAVQKSTAGDGFGFMLGGGIGCYDLDHVLVDGEINQPTRDFIAAIPEEVIFTEVSMSGTGLHIFVLADERPGTRTKEFEFYSRARFIAVTGNSIKL